MSFHSSLTQVNLFKNEKFAIKCILGKEFLIIEILFMNRRKIKQNSLPIFSFEQKENGFISSYTV